MKGFFFIGVLLVSFSCTKWHEVKEGNGILYVDDAQSAIHKAKEMDWEVGLKKDHTISKGIQFKFDIPKITSDDAAKLVNKYGVDSWIFKIIKSTRGRKQILGHIIYDLTNITRVSNDITVHVFYHAAAVSQTFRKFKCPAFNHRFRLDQFQITETPEKYYDVFANRGARVPGALIRPSFAPVIFSGDLSLVGSYTVEFALFNSKEKKAFSRWYEANNRLDIITEDRVIVPSCSGIKEENDLENIRPPKAEEFRIK